MTEPTDQHREQAREAIRAAAEAVGEYLQAPPSMWDTIERLIAQRVAPTLSSRDTEVREVLEGLRMGGEHDGGCWCIESPTRTREPEWKHNKYCKAATALYAKLQPLPSENPGASLQK